MPSSKDLIACNSQHTHMYSGFCAWTLCGLRNSHGPALATQLHVAAQRVGKLASRMQCRLLQSLQAGLRHSSSKSDTVARAVTGALCVPTTIGALCVICLAWR